MKLKSLLLGSAAALALSTGAYAADVTTTFVSLGVCDAYGITGLTIESDDTCLSISGSVSYEFEVSETVADGFGTDSSVDWGLAFEATTQTDAGAAVAHISLVNADVTFFDTDAEEADEIVADDEINTIDGVEIDAAYVQFGDTTVLSAGKKGSIFDTSIGSLYSYGIGDTDLTEVDLGGHVIQLEALVADGFTVLAALEDLDSADGSAGLGVEYVGAGITAEAGVLYDGVFSGTDDWNYYARVGAEFDSFGVNAGVVGDDNGKYSASLGASATFDMFTLAAEGWFNDDDQYGVGAEGSFAATDTVTIIIGAYYEEEIGQAGSFGDYNDDDANDYFAGAPADTYFTVYGGAEFQATETIAVSAEAGYAETDADDLIYGTLGATYAPGGNFSTGLEAYADTNDNYALTFNASKSF